MLDSSLGVESSGVEEDFRDFGGKVSICIYMIQVIGWHVGIYIFSFCRILSIHMNRELRVWRLYTDDLL